MCHDQEDLKIGIDDFSYKELDADHRSDLSSHGMDHERLIYKFLDGLFGIQNLGLCIVIFSILIYLFMTAAADQAAEILQAEFCYAAGAYEDPEKVSE